jgi:hypothetical protein
MNVTENPVRQTQTAVEKTETEILCCCGLGIFLTWLFA